MRICLVFICLLTTFTQQKVIEKEKLHYESFGSIVTKDGDIVYYIASSFICYKPNLVITCLHVVKDLDSLYYYPGNHNENYLLTTKATFAPLDLAILELPDGVVFPPLILEKQNNNSIGDTIDYLGYDRPMSKADDHATLTAKQSKILSIDSQFLYFNGYCHTGFSGAPIMNMNSRVIGMISKGKVLNKEENLMLVQCSLLETEDFEKYNFN